VRHRRGFTLIELLVVMAVLGVLGGMLVPLAELHVRRERERELQRALWEIRDAIDSYQRASASGAFSTSRTGYPPSLQALTRGAMDSRNGTVLYFLRRIPRDPFADATLPAEQTWALRSYQSEPDRPMPGDDVYDVASRSPLVGLNGVPLREW
jgi:general secretion pathway protein G